MNSSNLCTATKLPEGCHAIVRSVARLLSNIPDPRRSEGKLYKLQHVLLFSILAVVTGGNSYRSIVTFIKVHRRRFNAAFCLHWRRAPAHTSIRYILQALNPRRSSSFSANTPLVCAAPLPIRRDASSRSTQDTQTKLRQFHRSQAPGVARLRRRSRSRPVTRRYRGKVQRNPRRAAVARELNVAHSIVTLDAMHCQKKPSSRRTGAARLIVQLKQSALAVAESLNRLRFPAPVSSHTSVCTSRNPH